MTDEYMYFKGIKGKFKIYNNYPVAFSKEGKIVNVRTGKLRSPVYNSKSGYEMCMCIKDGTYRNLYVHRIIAELFLPNPDHLPYVTHIGDRKDNSVDNLRWISYAELKEIRKKKLLKDGKQEG